MHRRIGLLIFICILSGQRILAQSASISGKVTGSGAGISSATVSLLNAADSAWIRSEIADDSGGFILEDVPFGKYLVTATSIGYIQGSKLVEVNENKEYNVYPDLSKSGTALQEATVTAKKPFIEVSLGKVTVNIEGTTTTAASNVLDLMRRLPGVSVDQNGNITMRGKEGILVLINDRPTYLSGEDLAAYLKTITADETGQIELITQPGARYDATGNTGVINIKLRRNRKQGFNGNLTASYGLGIYFHRDESCLLNYRKNKWSLSLGCNDMEAIGFADLSKTQYYVNDQSGIVYGYTTLHSAPKERFSNTSVRMAADYSLSDRTTIGINARGTYHPNLSRGYIASSSFDDASASTVSNGIESVDGHIRRNVVANAYLAQKMGTQGSLDINADYLTYSKNAFQYITNTTLNSHVLPLPGPAVNNTEQKIPVDIHSLKADYTFTAKNGLRVEAGAKSSYVVTDFDAAFYNYISGAWMNDTGRSNHFLYKENINAVYGTVAGSIGKKWEARGGLRVEQTNASGLQRVHNQGFTRNYFSVFPTAFLAYKADSSNQFELNYGRRIDRPEYRHLNPFVYYSFQNNYEVGNPYLKPQYTHNMELKHSYNNMLITTIAVSRTTEVMSNITKLDSATKVTSALNVNLASNDYVSVVVVFNKDLFKWWTINLSGSLSYATFGGIVNNKVLKTDATGYSLTMSTQLDLGKGWKAEIYGNYISAGRWSLTTTFDANMYLEAGASKKIGDHFTIRLSAADPFYFNRMNSHESLPGFRADSKMRFATQMFSLALTYSFGNTQGKQHNTVAIEEAGRVQ